MSDVGVIGPATRSHGRSGASGSVEEAIRASNDDELEDALHQFHGIHCLAHIQMLRAVVQKERRGNLKSDGVRTGADWLSLKLGLSSKVAHEWARTAHALEE